MKILLKLILGLLVVAAVIGGVYYFVFVRKNMPVNPSQGGQVTTTTPLGDGDVADDEDDDDDVIQDNLIRITSPQPNAQVKSPLTVEGEARGGWYFEASFPVRLLDGNGKELAAVPAQAQGDWMTEQFVPFKATFSFATPTTATGVLIFQKDNPSGLPQYDDERRIPVTFVQNQRAVKLYYYNPNADKDANGNIQCSREGLVAVNRTMPMTLSPIQDAVKFLLQGVLTAQEKVNGLTTEFPLEDVGLIGASLHDGTLTLQFTDPKHKTSGGSCRATLLWAQIEATAKQFPEVTNVRFIPEELFQP